MAKSIGGVEAIVYYGANYLSLRYLYAGTFLIAAFLSFSAGTSVGCIATLAPALVGFTDIPTVHTPLLAAALLGGAMFGDNLSFISDTTIAATQTQDCSMKDKFLTNAKMAIPAAIITLIILVILGFHYHNTNPELSGYVAQSSSIWLIIPYLTVIILAFIGLNVFVVLFLGIIATIIFDLIKSFDLLHISQTIYDGFTGMTEIFLLSMLTGGLAYMVEKQGGIQYIFKLTSHFIHSRFKAKLGISLLTGIVNTAVANNTVAILIVAPIAKKISSNFKIDPKNTASLLDISACIVQGLIPYGAQVLLLIKLTGNKVSYFDLVAQTYYLWVLGIVAIIYFKWISRMKIISSLSSFIKL